MTDTIVLGEEPPIETTFALLHVSVYSRQPAVFSMHSKFAAVSG